MVKLGLSLSPCNNITRGNECVKRHAYPPPTRRPNHVSAAPEVLTLPST